MSVAEPQIPLHVSPVFGELREYVAKSHPSMAPEAQDLLFSIAYTAYCRKKKEYVKELLANKSKPAAFKVCFSKFRDEVYYQDFCEEAANTLRLYAADSERNVLKVISGAVIDGVSNLVAPLDTKLESLTNLQQRSWKARFGIFAVETLWHSLQLVVAAAIVYFLSRALLWLPILSPWLTEISEHEIRDLLSALFGRGEGG